ncbi:hypothetical protein ACFE04_001454 [Oxalis oulophora]
MKVNIVLGPPTCNPARAELDESEYHPRHWLLAELDEIGYRPQAADLQSCLSRARRKSISSSGCQLSLLPEGRRLAILPESSSMKVNIVLELPTCDHARGTSYKRPGKLKSHSAYSLAYIAALALSRARRK